MKIKEFHKRDANVIKIYEFHMRIKQIINKNEFPFENQENQKQYQNSI